MEALLAEQSKLEKKGNLAKTIEDVQKTIDLLTNARASVAADPTSHAMTLAKLKSPLDSSFDKVNADLKEIYSSLNKYSKALDKKFRPVALPSGNDDPLSSRQALTNRAIAMHLLREGQFGVASTFIAEANAKTPPQDVATGTPSDWSAGATGGPPSPFVNDDVEMEDARPNPWTNDSGGGVSFNSSTSTESAAKVGAGELQAKFTEMYHILHALKNNHDLQPAIQWARKHSEALELRGSNLEFELCRLRFVELYNSTSDSDVVTEGGAIGPYFNMNGPLRALEYARNTFSHFSKRQLRETTALVGSLAFSPELVTSPYKNVFYDSEAWNDVSKSFVREFCGMLGLSEQSPLYTAVTAGGIALPVLEKLERVMGEVGGQWTSVNELPVEIPLPPSYLFHSIFVCPVSKEQATDANPPMMLPCGHVIAKESMEKISRGNKFKCPYCPVESYPRDAKKVIL
ncbi:hypothetical protein AAFC00_003108 [Neodothiora populina]|uniref:Regulator of gluconeogenesis Rmd5 n=1 Tax=Neodothiora populina TaxID=2781224 RepID=A0ABR3P9B2_9PEZI